MLRLPLFHAGFLLIPESLLQGLCFLKPPLLLLHDFRVSLVKASAAHISPHAMIPLAANSAEQEVMMNSIMATVTEHHTSR